MRRRRQSKKAGGGEAITCTGTILPAEPFHTYTGACTQPTIGSTNKTEEKPESTLSSFDSCSCLKIAIDLGACKQARDGCKHSAVVYATSFLSSQRTARDLPHSAHQFASSLRRFSHSYMTCILLLASLLRTRVFRSAQVCYGTYANVRIFV